MSERRAKGRRHGLNLPGSVPRQAPEEPPRRQQWSPAKRPAKHLSEHYRTGRHQCPAPEFLLLAVPGILLVVHSGARHDANAARSRKSLSRRRVSTVAVEREKLLSEQRGETVGADRDVEARLGAGDHDPDREVTRLGVVAPVGILDVAGVEEADEAGGESIVEALGAGAHGRLGSGSPSGLGLRLPRGRGQSFGDVEYGLRLREEREGRRRRRHFVGCWRCGCRQRGQLLYPVSFLEMRNEWAGPNAVRPVRCYSFHKPID